MLNLAQLGSKPRPEAGNRCEQSCSRALAIMGSQRNHGGEGCGSARQGHTAVRTCRGVVRVLVGVSSGANKLLEAQRDAVTRDTRFRLITLRGGRVALKSVSTGKFVRACVRGFADRACWEPSAAASEAGRSFRCAGIATMHCMVATRSPCARRMQHNPARLGRKSHTECPFENAVRDAANPAPVAT